MQNFSCKIVPLLLFPLFFCCKNELELDGDWFVNDMTYNGETLYPNSTDIALRIKFNGFEGTEKMIFNSNDSTVIIPGFNSASLKTTFSQKNDKIIIGQIKTRDTLKNILEGTYDVIFYSKDDVLRMQSNKVYIHLINQKRIIEETTHRMFYGN